MYETTYSVTGRDMGLGLLHNQAATVNECATGRFVFTF
jgi:hypothetical protein